VRRSSRIAAPLLLAASVLFAALAAAAEPTPRSRHDATDRHSFDDVEHWVKVFDDPERDAWQKPAAVVQALALATGMSVADLGAGTGYFSPYLSAAVGDGGTVYALEVEPKLVEHLKDRAEKGRLRNVVPLLALAADAGLPAGGVDLILIVDTLHHIDDRPAYLRRLRQSLKPNGRVAVIDFEMEKTPVGPPLDHRLAREQVIEEFNLAGYKLIDEPRILPYQYFLVFR